MTTSPLQEKPHAASEALTSSASVIIDGHYVPPPEDKDGKVWVRTCVLVHRSAFDLYEMWRNIEAVPAWQEQMSSVTRTGETTSRWVMQSGDKTIEWDSKTLADEPGKRIAWSSIEGETANAGEVIFEPAPSGEGTLVTVLQEFGMGKLAGIWEAIVGRGPKQTVIENLRHFKALVETGEIPRNQGQPHGSRGTIGEMKKSLYGERIKTPGGTKLKAS